MASSGDSNNGTPAVKRDNTMQRTAKEAEEYGYGCTCGESPDEHDHDDSGNVVAKPARQSTMARTAQEGIQYLKDQRKDTLLEKQGLVPPRQEEEDEAIEPRPRLTLAGDRGDSSGESGGESDEDGTENGESKNGQEKLSKQRTMLATAKEGEDLLENYMGGKPDPNARTRHQQKNLEHGENDESDEEGEHSDDQEEDEEGSNDGPDAKKPRRMHTMQETAQEGHQIIEPGMGGTRSETAAVRKAEKDKESPKRKH